ncbi:MAG: hypothetical protein ABFS18_04050 [Thermodesulfobacteriota bacterium]
MNIKVWSFCFMFFAVVAFTGSGCAPQKVQLVPRTIEPVVLDAVEDQVPLTDMEFQYESPQAELSATKAEQTQVLPSVPFVDQRMMVYADKFTSWETLSLQVAALDLSDRLPPQWDQCLAGIAEVFRGYSVLMEALLAQDTQAVMAGQLGVDPWLIYQNDIVFLEGECQQVFTDGAVVLGGAQEKHGANTEFEEGTAVATQHPGGGLSKKTIAAPRKGDSQPKQKLLSAADRSGQWDKAVLLLESGQYDDAIDAFGMLFNTEYDIPARANIQKAAEVASVGMRRKSANIFVKARREMEYELKKELLRESWQLLHDITVKYPEVKLIGKVRQNLLIIEKHIDGFDPLMLQELRPVAGAAQEDLPEEYLY